MRHVTVVCPCGMTLRRWTFSDTDPDFDVMLDALNVAYDLALPGVHDVLAHMAHGDWQVFSGAVTFPFFQVVRYRRSEKDGHGEVIGHTLTGEEAMRLINLAETPSGRAFFAWRVGDRFVMRLQNEGASKRLPTQPPAPHMQPIAQAQMVHRSPLSPQLARPTQSPKATQTPKLTFAPDPSIPSTVPATPSGRKAVLKSATSPQTGQIQTAAPALTPRRRTLGAVFTRRRE